MKRNIILVILLFIFNALWVFSISYTNRFIVTNELMIVLGKNEDDNPIEEVIPGEEIVEYDGENYAAVGKKIEKYLVKTTLENYGEYIAKKSINKGVNPYLIAAMIIINSNCEVQCNAIVDKCNNVGDLKGTSGGCFGGTYKRYNTLQDGIDDLINYVLLDLYANDLKNPNAFYQRYEKNSAWSYRVTRYMERIKLTK